MRVELRVDSGHFARDLGITTLAVASSILIVYPVTRDPLVFIVLAAVATPLAVYALYVWRAGWYGVILEDGSLYARFVGCLRVGERRLEAERVRVRLVWRNDPLWPLLRLCGFYLFSGFGLFQARNGTRYYALIGHGCRGKAVYLEAGGLRLFICTESVEVDEFLEGASRLPNVEVERTLV